MGRLPTHIGSPVKFSLEQLDALYADGLTPLEIARELGVCHETVYKWLKRLGVYFRIKAPDIDTGKAIRMLNRGYTGAEVARILGCTPVGLRTALRKRGYPPRQINLDNGEKSHIIRLARAGHTRREISRATGRGLTSIQTVLNAAGVGTRGRRNDNFGDYNKDGWRV